MSELEKIEPANIVPAANATPMQMIASAVQNGADMDKLEKLMELQERWESNEARKAYNVAMNDFKKSVPDIIKNKKVGFGNTKYKHATLSHVCDVISETMSAHGLSHSWEPQQTEKEIIVTCIIKHALGHSERTTLSGPKDTSGAKNAIQAIGSTVTYLQRYTLLAAVGMAARDTDDDANTPTNSIQNDPSEDLIETSKEYAEKGFSAYRDWFQQLDRESQVKLTGHKLDSGLTVHETRKIEAETADTESAKNGEGLD